MRITGKTKIMFILADEVGHIIGTDVLNQAFAARGLDVAASPLSIPPQELGAALRLVRRMRNVAGFGVTIPHKIPILEHVDELTEPARDIGAVNYVRRNEDGSLTGHNIDGEGFVMGLRAHGVTRPGARVLQVGAGGAGRAIAFALADAGVASIDLVNRDAAKADELAHAVARRYRDVQTRAYAADSAVPFGQHDLIVNTTSLGMNVGDTLPVSPKRLAPPATVADIVMRPPVTPLLTKAAQAGCRTVPGLAMMQPQPLLVARFLGLGDWSEET